MLAPVVWTSLKFMHLLLMHRGLHEVLAVGVEIKLEVLERRSDIQRRQHSWTVLPRMRALKGYS